MERKFAWPYVLALATSGLGLGRNPPRNLGSPQGCQSRLVGFVFHGFRKVFTRSTSFFLIEDWMWKRS